MTNTESRSTVELEELAPWDDADVPENDERATEAEMAELAAYGFDSDNRTLVGLGPVEREGRSRRTGEIPDSERMPKSESPGPFITDDDDEELSRALRGPRLGSWAAAVPTALVLAAVAVAVVRGLTTPPAPPTSKPAVAAIASAATVAAAQKMDTARSSEPALPLEHDAKAAEDAPAEANGVNERREIQAGPARAEVPARGAAVSLSVAPPVLPVQLPELPPPTVIDMSGGTDKSVGTLNVTSSPPSNVVLDGRPLGKAPRLVQLPSGTHTVVFIHPLYGRQSQSVKVSAGRTSNASADF